MTPSQMSTSYVPFYASSIPNPSKADMFFHISLKLTFMPTPIPSSL